MNFITLGINHRTASMDVREKILFSIEEIKSLLPMITFTMQLSAINLLKSRIKSLTKSVVIGNTTADALLKINIQPDIIANPSTIEGLLKRIVEYFEIKSVKHSFNQLIFCMHKFYFLYNLFFFLSI